MAYPPVAAFTLAHGVNVWRGLAAAAAIYLWAIAVAFTVVASYAALLRWIGSTRLKRAVGYLQMLTGVAAYGGIFILREFFGRRSLMEARLPDGPWLFAVPPAWFASYLEIANGASDVSVFVRAALSLALVGGLGMLLRGRLVETTHSVWPIPASRSESRRARSVPGSRWPFRRDEARAVTLLTRAHFRHDMRRACRSSEWCRSCFIYMVSGLREGNADPFAGPVAMRGPDLLGLMALLFPAVITRHLAASEGYPGLMDLQRHHGGSRPADRVGEEHRRAVFSGALHGASRGAAVVAIRQRPSWRDSRCAACAHRPHRASNRRDRESTVAVRAAAE